MILGIIFANVKLASSTQEDPAELVSALAGEDAVARFTAEEKLAEMGNEALPALEPLAISPGFTLPRQYAINILAQIESEQSIRLLLRILAQEPEVKIRALICRHLGRFGVEEAVPIIGKWLLSIRGKSFKDWDSPGGGAPQVLTPAYAWIVHVHALREIGNEKGTEILEKMLTTKHGGRTGRALTTSYQENLRELKKEAKFWGAVRQLPGLEQHLKLLFHFFRRDTLALIRLYRDKVIHLGLEGRWVLEDMKNHQDEKLRQAAIAVLKEYDNLKKALNSE